MIALRTQESTWEHTTMGIKGKMCKENLVPLKPKGDPYSDAVRAKVKGTSSPKRKLATMIGSIPRMGPERLKTRAVQLMKNPEVSALNIMEFMDKLVEKADLSDGLKIQLLGQMCKAHQTVHGTKNLNMNIDITPGSAKNMEDIWQKIKKEDTIKQDH